MLGLRGRVSGEPASPPTIEELGVCPDCEEVFEVEEDYWGWG